MALSENCEKVKLHRISFLDVGCCTTSSRNQSPSNLAKQFGFWLNSLASVQQEMTQKCRRSSECSSDFEMNVRRLSTFFLKMPAHQQQELAKTRDKRITVNEIAQVSACVNDVRLCRANDSDIPQRPRWWC